MSLFSLMNHSVMLCEVNLHMFHIWNGKSGWTIVLERLNDGKLTQECCQRLSEGLKNFRQASSSSQRILCAINGWGVSLRRLRTPPSNEGEIEALIRMQIESEFPLPPDELAWGYEPIPSIRGSFNNTGKEYGVAAVKKEVVEQYAALLRGAGFEPEFTLSAFNRRFICPQPGSSFAILDIGPVQTEIAVYENGVPVLLRFLPWGADHLHRKLCSELQISSEDAQSMLRSTHAVGKIHSSRSTEIAAVIRQEMIKLSELAKGTSQEAQWYVTSDILNAQTIVDNMTSILKDGAHCLALSLTEGTSCSAAISGMSRKTGTSFLLKINSSDRIPVRSKPKIMQWAALFALLAMVALSIRYLEPILFKPALTAKIKEIQDQRKKLPLIDQELNFLQYLKTNQPGYLDALVQIANAAPQGTLVDTLSMNRRGEISLRGTFREPPQASMFRSNLVVSGHFGTVVAADLSPSQDRQKWTARINAQWNATKILASAINSTNEIPYVMSNTGRVTHISDKMVPSVEKVHWSEPTK